MPISIGKWEIMGIHTLDAKEIVRLALINQWQIKRDNSTPTPPLAPPVEILPKDLIPFAVEKGALGVLLSALKSWGLLSLFDKKELEKAKVSLAYTELLNIAMKRELGMLFRKFEDQGIEVILIKGHDIINRYYNDFKTRPTTDADVLVHQKDFGTMIDILKKAGYMSSSGESDNGLENELENDISTQWFRGSFCIDIHTEIMDEERIRKRKLLPTVKTEDIFASAVKMKIGDTNYLSPDPYHTLILSSLHALKHSYLMDYWFLDMGKIIENLGNTFSLKTLFERAGSEVSREIVGKMLWIVTELFDFPLREDEIARFRPSRIERGLISAAIGSRRSLQFGDILLGLYIDNWWQKFYYYKELLFPDRDVLLKELGNSSSRWGKIRLYLSRTIHLLKSLFGIFLHRKG